MTEMKNKLLRIKLELNEMANTYISQNKSEAVLEEMYITYKKLYKYDFQTIATSLKTDVWEVEAAYDDAFMKALEVFDGGDFVNLLSKVTKNKRIDLARHVTARDNRFILESQRDGEDDNENRNKSVLETGLVDLSYSLASEIEKPIEQTRRDIINYLVGQADDGKTAAIVDEWLDETVEENNILKIAKRLGIPYETARRKLKKLQKYYDDHAVVQFGDVRAYF